MKTQPKAKSKSSNNKLPKQPNSANKLSQDNSSETPWNSKSNSASNSLWSDSYEHFPALGDASAPVPTVNIWEERKSKQAAVKALEPQNQYDEEAMLQQALALSMREAAEEEERQRKVNEKYMLQIEAMKSMPEQLKYLDAPDKSVSNGSSEFESLVAFQPTKECRKETFSNSTKQSCNQNVKAYSSSGAKPKINKIIERFGSWGLKDEKETNNSERLSDFVEEIVNKKSLQRTGRYDTGTSSCKNGFKNVKENAKEEKPSALSDPWNNDFKNVKKHTKVNKPCHIPDAKEEKPSALSDPWNNDFKNVKKNTKVNKPCHIPDAIEEKPAAVSDLWNNDEILYDGNGTFTDIEDVKSDSVNEIEKNYETLSKDLSPSKVLDTWLNTQDDDDFRRDAVINDRKRIDVQNNDNVNFINSDFIDNNLPKCEQFKSKLPIFTEADFKSQSLTNKNVKDLDPFPKKFELVKSSWPDCNRKNNQPQNNSETYNYNISEHSITKNVSQSLEPSHILSISNNDIWSDKTSTSSPYRASLSDKQIQHETELDLEIKSNRISKNMENDFFNSLPHNKNDMPPILPPQPAHTVSVKTTETISNNNDVPPILPPQPASMSSIKTENETLSSDVFNFNSSEQSTVTPTHSDPEIQPTFPTMNNFVCNPTAMFPGFSPLVTCGMDPVTMRQMLMLSNPFFASQLLAMERYYRSIGMPVDLFSYSPTAQVPPIPGMMGPIPTTVSSSPTFTLGSQLQNQSGNDSCVPMSENPSYDQNSFGTQSLGVASGISSTSTLSAVENDGTDTWYKNYFPSESSAAIPPPKPPMYNDANDNILSRPKNLESNQGASSFIQDNVSGNTYIQSNSTSFASNTAVEACMSKTNNTTWSDDEDKSLKVNSKNTCRWYDGWEDDSLPTKSIHYPSISQEKRKTVCRQPSRQPQFSHYQKK